MSTTISGATKCSAENNSKIINCLLRSLWSIVLEFLLWQLKYEIIKQAAWESYSNIKLIFILTFTQTSFT